jgi:hypothetical protein
MEWISKVFPYLHYYYNKKFFLCQKNFLGINFFKKFLKGLDFQEKNVIIIMKEGYHEEQHSQKDDL